MERVSNRSLHARLTFQREIKIGIAKNVKQRNRDIDRDVKGKVVILSRRVFKNARAVERALHRQFRDSNFRMKGGRQAGVTEWHYMNPLEYAILELTLSYYSYRGYFLFFYFTLLLGAAIYAAWITKAFSLPPFF